MATIFGAFTMSASIAGCNASKEQKDTFKSALNNYYSSKQDCLWVNPIKLPAAVDDGDQAQKFNALVDAGLLQPAPGDKARDSNHAGEYVLSDMGKFVWTADPAHPGYGNFCFGPPQVDAVVNFKRIGGAGAEQYAVRYRASVSLPAWADVPQIEKAFPKLAAETAGQSASATLSRNNNGWQVQDVSPPVQSPLGS